MFKITRRWFLKAATAPAFIMVGGKKLTLTKVEPPTVIETGRFSSGILEPGIYTVKIQDIVFESGFNGSPLIKFELQEKESGKKLIFCSSPMKAPEFTMRFLEKFDRFTNFVTQDSIDLSPFRGREATVKVVKDTYNGKYYNRVMP